VEEDQGSQFQSLPHRLYIALNSDEECGNLADMKDNAEEFELRV